MRLIGHREERSDLRRSQGVKVLTNVRIDPNENRASILPFSFDMALFHGQFAFLSTIA